MSHRPSPLRLLSCLLVVALMLWAGGVLEVGPHDHDSSDFCRICSAADAVDVDPDHLQVDSPRLVASAAPDSVVSGNADSDLLIASPLRGPPAIFFS